MTKPKKSYTEMLKEELLAIAQRLGLTNLNKLRKDEIIDLIKKTTAKQEQAGKAAKGTTAKTAAGGNAPKTTRTTSTSNVSAARSPSKKPTVPESSGESSSFPAAKSSRRAPSRSVEPVKSSTEESTREKGMEPVTRPSPLGPVSSQADVTATKYSVGPTHKPEELQKIDDDLPELPESYGDNRIVLLPRDISWLFAYWDLTHEYKEAARSAGGNVLALRLYDVTSIDFDGTNAHAMYEYECAEWARSWYIPIPVPDRDFVVEIGYRGADQWFPLARSNKVSVPSDQPSTWIKDDFISIQFEEDLRQIRDRFKAEESAPSNAPSGASPMAFPSMLLFDDGEIRVMVGGAFLSPSGVPVWPMFSAVFSGAMEVTSGFSINLPSSQMFVPGSQAFIPGSQAFLPGSLSFIPGSQMFVPGSVSFVPGSQAFLPTGFFQLPSSPGFAMPYRIPKAPEPTAENREQTGNVEPPPLQVDSTQYPDAVPVTAEPPLLLATMEMVITGRSLPGTEIKIADRAIPLGPDGCFSLRITVPEGLRELPIEARSSTTNAVRRMKVRVGREIE